jgi:ribosomal protein S18 acetylase RimI-like enzyme
MTAVVRYARASDAEGILRCLESAFEPYRREYTGPAYRDTVLDAESLRARMQQMTVFVAERDGGVIGTIAAGEVDGDDGHLRGMAVLPACEGTGAGRVVLQRALDALTVAGCRRVTLDTTEPLARARRFYERAGFARTQRATDFFGMPLHEYAASLDATFTFREAGPRDAGAIRTLVNAAFLVERDFVTGDRLSEENLRHCLETGTFLIAARPGEPPSASIFLRPNGDRRTYLGMLAVDPALRRRRLGSLMMTAAERHCRVRGDEAIDISVVNLRAELPPIYRARGFVETGTGPFADPRLFRSAHFIHMTLTL